MKKTINLIVLLVVGFQLQAQQEMSLPLMNHLVNSAKSNPAYQPTNKWTVSLPSIGFSMLHTGPSFSDVYKKMGSGKYAINGTQGLEKFDAKNTISGGFDADLIGVNLAWDENVISFSYGAHVNAAMTYTGDGAKLLLKGNGAYIGQNLSVGPSLSITAYDKLGFGYARKVDKWSFGGRVNLLFGRKALMTSSNLVELKTSSDYYALDLKTDYTIHSADFMDIDMNTNEVSFGDMSYRPFGNKGFGVGLDLGASYQVNYDINVFGSVTNLGAISWKKDVTTYSSNKHLAFDGVRLQSLAELDTASLAGMLDSIQKFVEFEKSTETFKTNLGPKFILGGTWKVSDKITASGVIDVTKVMRNFLPAVGVGMQYKVAPWIQAGGNFSYQNKRINHLGLNATFNIGPVQLFMATDNIFTFILPNKASALQFRTGLNLKFGRVRQRTTIRGLG